MPHLIEYIGGTGVKTTDLNAIHSRWSTPRPGDVIDFVKMGGVYPFTQGRYGTIDYIDKDRVHFCCHMGSIFLSTNGVSISGGPFQSVNINKLTPAFELREQQMWNWGDHSPGADMGVYYRIDRPVFILEPA